MLTGVVRDRLPYVTVEVATLEEIRTTIEVECIVQTGFRGGLTLPARLIRVLDVEPVGMGTASFAAGNIPNCRMYRLLIVTEDGERAVTAYELETDPRLGTEFLQGHRLRLQMQDGGTVEIERMPSV